MRKPVAERGCVNGRLIERACNWQIGSEGVLMADWFRGCVNGRLVERVCEVERIHRIGI